MWESVHKTSAEKHMCYNHCISFPPGHTSALLRLMHTQKYSFNIWDTNIRDIYNWVAAEVQKKTKAPKQSREKPGNNNGAQAQTSTKLQQPNNRKQLTCAVLRTLNLISFDPFLYTMKTVPKRNHACVHTLPSATGNFLSAGQGALVRERWALLWENYGKNQNTAERGVATETLEVHKQIFIIDH